MNLQERIELMSRLGNYLLSNDADWKFAKEKASVTNQWFTEYFIDIASGNIAENFLKEETLNAWAKHYHLDDNITSKKVGIIMAGNIPLVGFHDLLCVFIAGHTALIKPSSKDEILLRFIIDLLAKWNPGVAKQLMLADKLNNCDAYIATGSNNTARYFDYYFGKYPSIIRRNRTSVAVLTGNERAEELDKLADDIHLFFGLGCRNVTKIYVPSEYDFVPLLNACRKYKHFSDHPKYRNNFDYYLALQIMNHRFYMTNQTLLLLEAEDLFTPVSQVNYEFYENGKELLAILKLNENIQAIVGRDLISFGKAQQPAISNYADGVDIMQFLLAL